MNIKNIIFDFGGVILDIDPSNTQQALANHGFHDFGIFESEEVRQEIFNKLEKGIITPEEFRKRIRKVMKMDLTDQDLDDAWSALLLDIPRERIEVVEQVKKNYNIFLLSNSNEIHYDVFLRDLQLRFGYHSFDDLFNKAYFSFDLHMRKPDPEVFEFVLYQHELNPEQTLFIDDTPENIEVAEGLNIQTHLLKKPQRIRDIFKQGIYQPV